MHQDLGELSTSSSEAVRRGFSLLPEGALCPFEWEDVSSAVGMEGAFALEAYHTARGCCESKLFTRLF